MLIFIDFYRNTEIVLDTLELFTGMKTQNLAIIATEIDKRANKHAKSNGGRARSTKNEVLTLSCAPSVIYVKISFEVLVGSRFTCICICICICLCMCICVCIYICVYMYMYMCMYVYVYVY